MTERKSTGKDFAVGKEVKVENNQKNYAER